MKYLIITVFVVVIGTISYGFYLKNSGDPSGEITIGIGVLATAFILMPLFIFHRYKDKNMTDFRLDKWFDEINKNKEK